jgi:hypothetical protein
MALELVVDGDMGEGEELAHGRISKGKQRSHDDQPTEREDGLQIMLVLRLIRPFFFSIPFTALP